MSDEQPLRAQLFSHEDANIDSAPATVPIDMRPTFLSVPESTRDQDSRRGERGRPNG
ncbi:hypothetical protein [Nocardia aurantia]|uniref:Uncharacterized protein n=1 Tax=Nocardia aurantia TaxID=2585199 RepID=A0A7K0DPA7_9NOCA|nr:hypothetical protein [Nocardia aurantia]MQY27585.1 hypothetical protein [Nocardia aurantia]